ncbi:unnamed protein product, partial [marine sediment metagenome]
GMKNIIVKNIMEIPKLKPSEQRVLLFLGTVFEGEKPSEYQIAKAVKMDKRTVKKAIENLKEKGIIE